MAALLAANGRRVATYTSPHLVDFRERMIVGGVPIPPADVVDFIARHIAGDRGDRRDLLRGDDGDGVRAISRAPAPTIAVDRGGTRRTPRLDERARRRSSPA